MHYLVIGGAGYIGSHLVQTLVNANHTVTVLDNLSSGHKDAVLGAKLIVGDMGQESLIHPLLSENQFDGVFHFGACIEVGESVTNPSKYYNNNLRKTLTLLDAMVTTGTNNLVFSSTAAIFGEPQYTPIDELHPTSPINPYGKTKLMVENILQDYDLAYGLKYSALRYFNAAGASPQGNLGERHNPETHLIPLILQAASGRRESICIYGDDYNTPDGTCVRDFIHVADLCDAHIRAVEYLEQTGLSRSFNLGNGEGFSVREVIETVKSVTGKAFKVINAPRRNGDPAVLVADCALARSELSWSPQYSELESIISHAWHWEQHILSGGSPH